MTSSFEAGAYTRMPYDGTPYQSTATGVIPRFFKDSSIDPERTRKAKRPVYFEKEHIFVELISPGDIKSVPVKKVTQDVIDLYPAEYEAFLRGETLTIKGTPLEVFKDPLGMGFSVGEIKTLKVFNVETLEQLANASDTALQQLGMGYRARQNEVRAFMGHLEGQKDQARDDKIEELQRQIAALTAMKLVEPVEAVLADNEPVKRGPGRPRKDEIHASE